MAIEHAKPGEVINVRPLGTELVNTVTKTLVKTDTLEILRLVLPAGKVIDTHQAHGEITVQCLEGRAAFTALGKTIELEPGELLYLSAHEPHSVRGIEDASLLLTLLLPAKSSDNA